MHIHTFDVSKCMSDKVTCSRCGLEAEKSNARVKSKRSQVWECKVCNSKVVQLSKMHGGWPVEGFQGLSDEEKAQFHRDVGTIRSSENLSKFTQDFLVKSSKREQQFYDGGEFLPLSVWKTRGFDDEAIAKNSSQVDRNVHPVLGEVYRVAIVSCGVARTTGWERKSATESRNKRDRSSSSGSVKSRMRKEKKRAAKDTKQVKESIKAREKLAKATEAVLSKTKTAATRIVDKLKGSVSAMTINQSQVLCEELPHSIRATAKDSLDWCTLALQNAERVAARPDSGIVLEDMKDCTTKLKVAKQHDASVTNLLASIERARRTT